MLQYIMDDKIAKLRPGLIVMDLGDFTAKQSEALLDLIVLAMYLDGNLAKIEEIRVRQLLAVMGFDSDYDRNRQFDASVTRVRRDAQSPEAANLCAARLAANFTMPKHQQTVLRLLSDQIALDGSISAEESKFLSFIKETFKM